MIDRITKDRIMDAARIEDVIGEFVSLRRQGSSYIGLCPFHQDSHPSFSVSATKQIFKCFSCGHAGNVVSFLMDHEHISYSEALKYLAKKYGIEIVEKEETPEEAAQRMRSDSLLIVNEAAQQFYHETLWDPGRSNLIGLSYFRQRGFTDDTIRRFGLGYAPKGYDTFTRYALEHGYKEEYLLETGLSVRHDDGRLGDRFYERVMFPIYSLGGKVIAFGGRIMSSDKKVAKYVNSPESIIYSKSRSTLYGLFQAKRAIAAQDKCIMVEGYADVISMHQRGIENVVASSGTALTQGHIALVKRFTSHITFIYDSDQAGIKAALRGIDMVLEEGMEVKTVLLPDGDDPDSFARTHAKDDILEYIASHEQDFISFKIDILSKDLEPGDIYGRTQMISEIVQTVSMIPDDIVRNLFVEKVAQQFGLQKDSLFARVLRLRRTRQQQRERREGYKQQSAAFQEGAPQDWQPGYPAESYAEEPAREPAGQGADSSEYLAVCERSIVELLVKYGEYTIHWESNMVYGGEQTPEVTVAEYIRSSLDDDGLQLENRLWRIIYNDYYALERTASGGESEELLQGRIIKHFTFHDNPDVVQATTEFLSESHPLTIKQYNDSLTPEEHRLCRDVPRAVLQYKMRLVTLRQTAVQQQIKEAETAGDQQQRAALMQNFLALSQVKIALGKELKKF